MDGEGGAKDGDGWLGWAGLGWGMGWDGDVVVGSAAVAPLLFGGDGRVVMGGDGW